MTSRSRIRVGRSGARGPPRATEPGFGAEPRVKLDAILTPGGSGAGLAARAGYPIIVVPFGLVPNAPTPALPSGFNAKPAPFGVGFTGASCSEPRLIELAYAFEQATKRRVRPEL